MARQKVFKQGKYDIEAKVDIQKPLPASFHTRVSCSVKTCRDKALYIYIMPTLLAYF